MRVGGRDFNQDRDDVERAMRGEEPEEIRKYLVEVGGKAYPPKQVLARATGWERQSFTTMEAQRVLNKLGFRCREAVTLTDGRRGWGPYSGKPESPELLGPPGTHRASVMEERIETLEAALATAQTAISGLDARLRSVEAGLEKGGEPTVDESLKLHYDEEVVGVGGA